MRRLLACCLALFVFAPAVFSKPDLDWPQWRGPARNGICAETGLLKKWPKGGPPLLWDTKKVNKEISVGEGLSSLAIAGGKIFTIGDVVKREQVEVKDKQGKVSKKNVTKGGNVFCFCLEAAT